MSKRRTMRKWIFLGLVALGLIALAALIHARLVAARSRELTYATSHLPGAQGLQQAQLIEQPALFPGIWNVWSVSLTDNQVRDLQTRCDQKRKEFPKAPDERSNGCIASYYYDSSRWWYMTLSLKGKTAEIVVDKMSKSEFEDLQNQTVETR